MTRTCIYMDHHATTPVHPKVLERMLPYFCEDYGNAASRTHVYGWRAESAVDEARGHVARLVGARKGDVVFTSGATEANNLALWGVAMSMQHKGRHIVTQQTEHKSVLDTCRMLEKQGCAITCVPVDKEGRVDPADVGRAIRQDTVLVSIMSANNEVGTVQPLKEIAHECASKGVLFHVDAVQSAAYMPLDMHAEAVDMLSLSAHKMYGPKGVGALVVKKTSFKTPLAAHMYGGGHEGGLRSGTLNVPGIVGFGAACERAFVSRDTDCEEVLSKRVLLQTLLTQSLERIVFNGCMNHRLPGNLHVSFEGVEGEALMLSLRDVAVSGGAACGSASLEPSHVMRALGVHPERAKSSIRFGIGISNTEEQVKEVAHRVAEKVHLLRHKQRR